MSLMHTGTHVGGKGARLAAALLAGLAAAAVWCRAAPGGDSATTRPAVRVEGDRLVTPDGWFRRVEVEKPKQAGQACVIPIHDVIVGPTYEAIRRKVIPIRARKDRLVIFDIDTPGGDGNAMAKIIRLIMEDLKDVYTIAYVNPDALSAGALISVACNEIVMSPTGRIGAAMPIFSSPTGGLVKLPEKIRGKFESAQLAGARVMAKRNGYDVDLIEGMITIDLAIWLIRHRGTGELKIVEASDWYGKVAGVPPGKRPTTVPAEPAGAEWEYVRTIAGPTKVVTLTTDEAVSYGLATRQIASMDELAAQLDVTGEPVILTDTALERLVAFLNSPIVTTILLFLGGLALYAEFHTPGFGVPGAVAILCFAILFGSRYLTGLAQVWEIALFLLGVGLLLVEAFVTPGFGLPGIAGIICCIAGLLAMFIPNALDEFPRPSTDLDWELFSKGLFATGVGFIAALIGAAVLSKYLPRLSVATGFVLAPADRAARPPVSEASPVQRIAPGDLGRVEGPCRPVGKVRFGSDLLDAVTEGDVIEVGAKVRVVRRDGNRIVVERA